MPADELVRRVVTDLLHELGEPLADTIGDDGDVIVCRGSDVASVPVGDPIDRRGRRRRAAQHRRVRPDAREVGADITHPPRPDRRRIRSIGRGQQVAELAHPALGGADREVVGERRHLRRRACHCAGTGANSSAKRAKNSSSVIS
jgi:hypothetical protein